jgi:hypothetical protein
MRLKALAELPNSKNLFVEKYMLDGIQDLCRETACFIEPITLTSIKDQSIYPMTITTANAEVIGFWEGKYDNANIRSISNRKMDHSDRQWETRSGTPNAAIYDGDTSVRFNVTPDTTGKAIQLEPIIMPSNVDGVVPPRIEKRHQEAIKSYVKWKIYEHPGEFFSIELALRYEKDYIRRKNRLKIEVAKDGEEVTAKPRSFVTGETSPPFDISLNE